jgi:hypothetical protein
VYLRVPGHRIQAQGAPFTATTCQLWPCDKLLGVQRVDALGNPRDHGVTGHGHAVCECGWTGAHLMTGASRRRNHREHKRQVRLTGRC